MSILNPHKKQVIGVMFIIADSVPQIKNAANTANTAFPVVLDKLFLLVVWNKKMHITNTSGRNVTI